MRITSENRWCDCFLKQPFSKIYKNLSNIRNPFWTFGIPKAGVVTYPSTSLVILPPCAQPPIPASKANIVASDWDLQLHWNARRKKSKIHWCLCFYLTIIMPLRLTICISIFAIITGALCLEWTASRFTTPPFFADTGHQFQGWREANCQETSQPFGQSWDMSSMFGSQASYGESWQVDATVGVNLLMIFLQTNFRNKQSFWEDSLINLRFGVTPRDIIVTSVII